MDPFRAIPESHPLHRLFRGLTEYAFMNELGIGDPPLGDAPTADGDAGAGGYRKRVPRPGGEQQATGRNPPPARRAPATAVVVVGRVGRGWGIGGRRNGAVASRLALIAGQCG